MLFEINNNRLSPFHSSWNPKELELEDFIITSVESEVPLLDPSVFGEPLLLISNQVKTRNKKRADILALDRSGNGVIVELKRDSGSLGVETQALQYLADFSAYKGMDFIKQFSRADHNLEDSVRSFLGAAADDSVEYINSRSRLILMARSFDPTIFSMGEWFSDKGVPFRCVEYSPIEIESRRFLSFSIAFDRSAESIFPISFANSSREPSIYWHNIASANDNWWKFLIEEGQIPACFNNEEGDQGWKILNGFVAGDRIVAYAKGYGAVGWGEIRDPNSYSLIDEGSPFDKLEGDCRHRLSINWKATAQSLSEGLPPNEVREHFGIYHPISTSVSINQSKGEKLIKNLNERFGNS
jgi:hypothetical protein